jgi:hypothetical protein
VDSGHGKNRCPAAGFGPRGWPTSLAGSILFECLPVPEAEHMAVTALSLAIFLGPMVWELLRKNKQLESRIHAIENLSQSFAAKVAGSAPVPLSRAIYVNIHLDETFWRETLQLSSEEVGEIKTSVPLHSRFAQGGLEQFEKWFYYDILVRI